MLQARLDRTAPHPLPCARPPPPATIPSVRSSRWLLVFASLLFGCGGSDDDWASSPGRDAGSPGSDAQGDSTSSCQPVTCAALGANCGNAPDGCGGTLTCGTCSPGEDCGGGGPNRCGVCSCALPHASSACNDTGCAIVACDPGWGNCNGSALDGCELDTATSNDHCGACGARCDDDDACTVGDQCVGGVCVIGQAVVCDPPGACEEPGTCDPDTGDCEYEPKPDGYQYNATESHRCCDGKPVDITEDEDNCGGCGLECAIGEDCESVEKTSGCSLHPEDTTGRCTCSSNSDCPTGIGSQQVCRTLTPYNGRCGPYEDGCAEGQTKVELTGCPDYCTY